MPASQLHRSCLCAKIPGVARHMVEEEAPSSNTVFFFSFGHELSIVISVPT
jgi:high-affinity nickel permease